MRPARYGDIVILLRSALMWAPLMIEEFRQQGIPAGGAEQGLFSGNGSGDHVIPASDRGQPTTGYSARFSPSFTDCGLK